MADKKTSNAEEPKNTSKKSEKADASKKAPQKADKKKSKKKNPFKSAGKFFKGVNSERKKVVWPKAKETIKNSVIVLVVVIILGVAIYAVDSVLSLGLRELKNAADSTTTSVSDTVSEEDTSAEDTTAADTTAEKTTQAAE